MTKNLRYLFLLMKWQRSFPFDARLLPQEVAASKAHARMIAAAGVLTADELRTMLDGLDQVKLLGASLTTDLGAPLMPQSYRGMGGVFTGADPTHAQKTRMSGAPRLSITTVVLGAPTAQDIVSRHSKCNQGECSRAT